MKLFRAFADPGYHTSIITTFGIDFDAYEAIVLARLREAGCRNNVLIADSRMIAHSMNDEARRPRLAGRTYSVVGAQPKGVFHPKLILQLGKTKGRLLVASANMTSPGLAGNLEVVGCVNSVEEDRSADSILQTALAYLAGFIMPGSVPAGQLDWSAQRTRWLSRAPISEGLANLGAAGQVTFLASNTEEGIATRFVRLIGALAVKRLIVISPYWDADLSALRQLKKALAPKATAVVIQKGHALFPVKKWLNEKGSMLFDADRIAGAGASRFAHAKVVIAETASADYVLYGSANCTTAALGSGGRPGINEEACLFRTLAPGEAIQVLGMETALSNVHTLDASKLHYKPAAEIPMKSLEQHLPGRFELCGTLLRWWPPQGIDACMAMVHLYDEESNLLVARLRRIGVDTSPVSFDCTLKVRPSFARVTAGDFESSLGIVVLDEAIRESQRPPTSRAAKDKLAMLFDEEAFEGLWLIEVIQKLDEAERRLHVFTEEKSNRRTKQSTNIGTPEPVTYEQFIAKRKPLQHGGFGGSQLASSNQESVRGFLNFLLGRSHAHVPGKDRQSIVPIFSMGDDTSDGDNALESDSRFNTDKQFPEDKTKREARILRQRQQFLKDTHASIAKAIETYIARTRAEANDRLLTVVDLLKLRAFLHIVLGTGSKQVQLLSREIDAQMSRRQVLPSYGENNWNWLTRRLLHLFFRDPAGPCINRVTLGQEPIDQLPEDVFECWATCCWALCATRVSVDSRGVAAKPGATEESLAAALHRGINLAPLEAVNNAIKEMFLALDARYGERLGVAEGTAWEEHVRLVHSCHPSMPA